MQCMKSEVLNEANIETVASETIITDPCILTEIDLKTCDTNAPNFVSKFQLKVTKSGKLTALAGYFDTFFDLENRVSFSTGPQSTRTHWQQTVFYLKNIVDVTEGKLNSIFHFFLNTGFKENTIIIYLRFRECYRRNVSL